MKKLLVLSLLTMLAFGSYASARVQYDSTGRNIVKDNTIRGQKRQTQYAAAAKINYNEKSTSGPQTEWAKKHTYKTFEPNLNYRYNPNR